MIFDYKFNNKNNIWDAASGYLLTNNGNVTASTTQTKFPSISSIYFDGSGDYISASDSSNFSFGNKDFTWEGWVYLTSYHATVSAIIHLKNDTALATSVLVLEIGSAGQLQLSTGTALITTGASADLSLNTWHHVAVSRTGSTLKIWLNGSQHASVTNSTSYSGSVIQIGAWRYGGYDYSITGYLQDVRITKGLGRYTSSFTPPTSTLSG